MLIEQCAYGNRWRNVSPAAKASFALGGFVAAFVAGSPQAALLPGGLVVLAAVAGAKIPVGRFLRAALPPLGFLLAGCLPLVCSFDVAPGAGGFTVRWLPAGGAAVAQLAARSCAALAALLFLALTTPMVDLIALLRRLKTPDVLLEIMVLCYRMLFVFSGALHDMRIAQAARLGEATPAATLRSLGARVGNLTLQIWQRAHALHVAAQSRNNDGAFRFLEPEYVHAERDLTLAALAGLALVLLAAGL